FIGNSALCAGCRAQPSDSDETDDRVNLIAHEIVETVTDPDGNAWLDSDGNENADKCAWRFGDTYTTDSGALANMRLRERDCLVQENFVNVGDGYCALQYP